MLFDGVVASDEDGFAVKHGSPRISVLLRGGWRRIDTSAMASRRERDGISTAPSSLTILHSMRVCKFRAERSG